MLYYLKSAFVKIDEPEGLIHNLSPFTLEVSTTDEENSGDLILPHKAHYFSDAPIFVRCIDGIAKTNVITAGVNPYDLSEMKFDSCCSGNVLCKSSCGADGNGIEGVIIDGVIQPVIDNFAVLDLSAYAKGDDETISYSDIAKIFSAKED